MKNQQLWNRTSLDVVMIVMAVLMAFWLFGMNVHAEAALPTEAEVYETLISYKTTYPEGTAWTNDNSSKYTPMPNATMYGCAAFASELQDAAFQTSYVYCRYDYDFDDIRVGDILRFGSEISGHSVIVLEKKSDCVVIAEGNYNYSVHWGRELTQSYVDSNLTYVWTRWPEGTEVYNNLLYYMDNGDGTATITGLREKPTPSIVYIPETINGLTVTKIGKSAFYYHYTEHLYVFLPDTVKEIEEYAFYHDYSMKVWFGTGVEYLDAYAIKGLSTYLPTPWKEGYTFAGWYDDDGTEITTNTFLDCGYFDETGVDCHAMHATWTEGDSGDKPMHGYIFYYIDSDGSRTYSCSNHSTISVGQKVTNRWIENQDGFTGWEIIGLDKSAIIAASAEKVSFTMPDNNVILIAHYDNDAEYVLIDDEDSDANNSTDSSTDNDTNNSTDTNTNNNTDSNTNSNTNNNTDNNTNNNTDINANNNTNTNTNTNTDSSSDTSVEITSSTNGWVTIGGKDYWYENGVRQGYDPNDADYRGKEIYDPGTDAWYWLDNVQQGAKATSKDVYQESSAGYSADHVVADASGNIDPTASYGKWVRYDENGNMVKGWQYTSSGTYYFDETYGTMAKGYVLIDGKDYYFNTNTGILEDTINRTNQTDNGWMFAYDFRNSKWIYLWYENGIRQGYSVDSFYRGKEIYDPDSDAWYWLDNVQLGAMAVSKDVYQESLAGDWGDIDNGDGTRSGKWVRYDENGHMVKGWDTNENGTYYFDLTYGTMAKGDVTIDGQTYHFNETTGVLE